MPNPGDSCSLCLLQPSLHPYTDPRCRPGLLHDAEVRLEMCEQIVIASTSASPIDIITLMTDKARAEVERLKND